MPQPLHLVAAVPSLKRLMPITMARLDCPKCGGTGWKIIEGDRELSPAVVKARELAVERAAARPQPRRRASVISIDARTGASAGGPRVAVLCDCVEAERTTRGLNRARIPVRYEHCDFVNYETRMFTKARSKPRRTIAASRKRSSSSKVSRAIIRSLWTPASSSSVPAESGKTHPAVAVANKS